MFYHQFNWWHELKMLPYFFEQYYGPATENKELFRNIMAETEADEAMAS